MNFLTLNNLGSLAAIVLVVVLGQRYRGLPRVGPLPRYAVAGAYVLIGAMALNAFDVLIVEVFFTPLCWTGYILWADGAVAALRGRSLLRDNARAFGLLTVASIPLWIIFEIYNLRLANWFYAGLPNNLYIRYAAFAWAFATVWPGIFSTAALLRAMDFFTTENSPDTEIHIENTDGRAFGKLSFISMTAGALFLIVPALVPRGIGVYLFGAVWLGPLLLLDPLNMRAGRASLWADLRRGDRSRFLALLWAGAVCGLMWEYWNHAAAARWVYAFPIFPEYRIFAMPVAGYLGFPAFALDCFVIYALFEPGLLRFTRTRPGAPAVLEL